MRVAITGATGTIGSALVGELRERGDEVTALSRDAGRASERLGVAAEQWRSPATEPAPPAALRGRDAVVHLLGETIAQRWSDEAKREIRASRVDATRNLVAALRALPADERPRVLVSQSAVGVYGPHGDERLDESVPAGDDFLARVVVDWEAEAQAAAELGLRVVLPRTGVVLSPEGGALEKMMPFFKLGVGGPVAGGRQYVPVGAPGRRRRSAGVRARHRGPERPGEPVARRSRRPTRSCRRRSAACCTGPPSRPCPRWPSRRSTARWRRS